MYDYVRYDLKEIAFPSSLPDPPHSKKRPKLTWHDRWCILRPNDYKQQQEDAKEDEDSEGSNSDNKGRRSCEPSALEEDNAVAARASTYTNATKNFVETYQEGLKDQLQEKADGEGGRQQQQQGDEPTKPPPQTP